MDIWNNFYIKNLVVVFKQKKMFVERTQIFLLSTIYPRFPLRNFGAPGIFLWQSMISSFGSDKYTPSPLENIGTNRLIFKKY